MAQCSAESHEVLGENITKLLSDKLYDKRKQAAMEIEGRVREASQKSGAGQAQVQRILVCLRRDYIESQQPAHKKGGLIGFAAVAIGLEAEIVTFLQQLMEPVLELFKDDDSRVRYYACEALYNIAKVANEAVLTHLNLIFDGLCRLISDNDTDVKSGAQHLDQWMIEVVTQASNFRVEQDFPQLLASKLQHRNYSAVRQLALAWISKLLTKAPEVDIVSYAPQYLDGVLNMLGDHSREVRQAADFCLSELLKAITSSSYTKASAIISDSTSIVVKGCFASDACSRLTAICWIRQFVQFQMDEGSRNTGTVNERWVASLPELLGGILNCVEDQEEEIARMAAEMNSLLLEVSAQLDVRLPVDLFLDQLLESMQLKDSMVVRTASLQWIYVLLTQSPDQMLRRKTFQRILTPIFDTLRHPEDEVVVAALRILAELLKGRKIEEDDLLDEEGVDFFSAVAQRILRLFASDRHMPENRRRLLIRELCAKLDVRRFYVTIATAISLETDLVFSQQLVITFNWVLITATETTCMREELLMHDAFDKEPVTPSRSPRVAERPPSLGLTLFFELIQAWFHNPVSALALCLWSQQYELATELTARISAFEPTLDLLRQLDQLVHLIESPIFSRLRLQLLEPRKHPALIECILGLAMLLPQAGAFNILRERISIVQSGLMLEAQANPQPKEVVAGSTSWWQPSLSLQSTGRAHQRSDSSMNAVTPTGLRGRDIANLLETFDNLTAAAQA